MSDLPNNTPNPVEASPAAAAPEAAPVLQAGPICEKLNAQGFGLTPVAPDAAGNETLSVEKTQLLKLAEALKADGFDMLVSVAGVDFKTHREVVYHVYSSSTHQWVTIKTIATDEKCPSLFAIWPAVDWHEREAFDLFGIDFEGHPNMKRLLMPDDWIGHPLRKDYTVNDPRLVWNER